MWNTFLVSALSDWIHDHLLLVSCFRSDTLLIRDFSGMLMAHFNLPGTMMKFERQADINEASLSSSIQSRTVHPVGVVQGEILAENSSPDFHALATSLVNTERLGICRLTYPSAGNNFFAFAISSFYYMMRRYSHCLTFLRVGMNTKQNLI